MRLERTLIGMVHVPPLPGSPRWEGSMPRVTALALADARALLDGGMDALLVENHGDVPFTAGRVESATIAAMAVVVAEIRRALPDVPLGVNVLKNDARAALAIACAAGAQFIRVNVHAGAVVADQGIVQSDAYHTLRDRRLLDADVQLFADVQGKHAVPLAAVELEQEARDLVHRGLADALVVSGKATGEATPIADVKRVRSVVPAVPLLVGSGVTADTVSELLSVADGVIVGTFVKRDGDVRQPVDPERVRRLVAVARGR
ncbi:MAG: phosphorybosylanthranilate isomerase [Candidatus Rokubacteria bacterium 13_1_40CM_69_27]|nr:MAG: phosphorybosylanthranilate isomerase [Candidatus Rokubacteria bacterium 13_1_40CM_69_27]OLC39854.1 MAG: phosphorybosylanthranilate isomerase [Candidatus Rokubacteria bacterium 13_1_40CM_4_69_5]